MITQAKAPVRISFAGGGTDIEPYCSEHGGCVVAVAIKRYIYATYPFPNTQPTEIEKVITTRLGCLSQLKITSSIPPMSGLGGSASCFVAGVKAVKPNLSKREIAQIAFSLERNIMGVAGGAQDQYVSAYGGLNFLTFGASGKVDIEPLKIPEGLEELLLLVYMGERADAGQDIIKDQMFRMNKTEFDKQKEIAKEMKIALDGDQLTEFGILLNEAWQSKLKFSPLVSNDRINEFYWQCIDWGAIGGKLSGAGGGGYMLLMEDPDRKGGLRKCLAGRGINYEDIEFDMEGVCANSAT